MPENSPKSPTPKTRKRKSRFGMKVHPSQLPKKNTVRGKRGPGGSLISSKPLAERLPVEGTHAYEVMTKLGVTVAQLAKSPDISQILARSVGPRQRVIDALRFSADDAAIEFLNVYDELNKSERLNVPFEAICIASDISPAAVLGATLMAAKIVGAQESALTTIVEHPEVVRQTIHFAKTLPGATSDRRMIHEAVGYLPTHGGQNVNVNLNGSGNPQLGPEEEEDDEKSFETAFPSVNQSLESWGEKRRKLLEGGKG